MYLEFECLVFEPQLYWTSLVFKWGRFVSGCQMVRYSNGGLKTGLKKPDYGPKCSVFEWSAKSCDFTIWIPDTHTVQYSGVWYSNGYCSKRNFVESGDIYCPSPWYYTLLNIGENSILSTGPMVEYLPIQFYSVYGPSSYGSSLYFLHYVLLFK